SPVFKDSIINSGEDLNTMLARITGTVGSYWPVQAESLVRQKNSADACAAVDAWLLNADIERHVMPNVALTSEETDRVTSIATSLTTYISEQALKFLTGERSLDTFDAYVGEVERIGLATYLETYQGALERYLSK
nr:hypothetical protein [Clostridia bacterium]